MDKATPLRGVAFYSGLREEYEHFHPEDRRRSGHTGLGPQGAVQSSVVAVSSSYTVTLADDALLVDTTGASRTITLPLPSLVVGRTFRVKKKAGGNNVIVQGASGNVDGGASVTISTLNAALDFVSDGTNYWTF